MKLKKRILSLALSMVFAVGILPVNASAATYTDVSTDAWYYDYIQTAVWEGLISGYRDGSFRPEAPLTRVQLVQILCNKYGKDVGSESGYSDIDFEHKDAKAITWATKEGFISGFEDGTFRPSLELTREQLVAILHASMGRPEVEGNLDQYSDKDQVQPYAVKPFIWAIQNGIISGSSATTLSPQGTATRAQMAVIMLSYASHRDAETQKETTSNTNSTPVQTPSAPGITSDTNWQYNTFLPMLHYLYPDKYPVAGGSPILPGGGSSSSGGSSESGSESGDSTPESGDSTPEGEGSSSEGEGSSSGS